VDIDKIARALARAVRWLHSAIGVAGVSSVMKLAFRRVAVRQKTNAGAGIAAAPDQRPNGCRCRPVDPP
jgi:hypothetical protein